MSDQIYKARSLEVCPRRCAKQVSIKYLLSQHLHPSHFSFFFLYSSHFATYPPRPPPSLLQAAYVPTLLPLLRGILSSTIMSNSTTAAMVDGSPPTKPPHRFSTLASNASSGAERVESYMASINGGGDSVTALAERGLAPNASRGETYLSSSRRCQQCLDPFRREWEQIWGIMLVHVN
ncbi:hypothetical protein F4823DRAFT_219206 [Ustulina deusta]|nr:hypothetical protein F4823DRAFT_219206 [Ustulina deusta]